MEGAHYTYVESTADEYGLAVDALVEYLAKEPLRLAEKREAECLAKEPPRITKKETYVPSASGSLPPIRISYVCLGGMSCCNRLRHRVEKITEEAQFTRTHTDPESIGFANDISVQFFTNRIRGMGFAHLVVWGEAPRAEDDYAVKEALVASLDLGKPVTWAHAHRSGYEYEPMFSSFVTKTVLLKN